MAGYRTGILSVSGDRTMHDNVLECTGELGHERCIAAQIGHFDGKGMTVTVEVSVEPVTCVEDVASGLCDVSNIIGHLDGEPSTVLDTVQTFCQIDILGAIYEESTILRIAVDGVDVKGTALLADTELVE